MLCVNDINVYYGSIHAVRPPKESQQKHGIQEKHSPNPAPAQIKTDTAHSYLHLNLCRGGEAYELAKNSPDTNFCGE